MAWYSSYRPCEESATEKTEQKREYKNPFVPIVIVGTAASAALMVLLLLTQAQLSQMGFVISSMEQELMALESRYEKLVVSHAEVFSPKRVEAYAVNELGMVYPNPDLIDYIEIDTADSSRAEPKG